MFDPKLHFMKRWGGPYQKVKEGGGEKKKWCLPREEEKLYDFP